MHLQTNHYYLYSISRRDIPLAQQAIQAAHAGIEYARTFELQTHPSYIHCTIRDQQQLELLRARLQSAGINTSEFYEPYKDWGLTAIACCLNESERHLLQGLPLWRLPLWRLPTQEIA